MENVDKLLIGLVIVCLSLYLHYKITNKEN